MKRMQKALGKAEGIDVLIRYTDVTECELCFRRGERTSICRDTGGSYTDPVHLCDSCIREIWQRTAES